MASVRIEVLIWMSPGKLLGLLPLNSDRPGSGALRAAATKIRGGRALDVLSRGSRPRGRLACARRSYRSVADDHRVRIARACVDVPGWPALLGTWRTPLDRDAVFGSSTCLTIASSSAVAAL